MPSKDLSSENILNQIIYRGEGNSSIVIALRDHSRVIRLPKKDVKKVNGGQDPVRCLNFIDLIMKPLIGPFISKTTELIFLKSDLVNGLSRIVELHRPLHRRDKTLVLDDQYALVMDDLCTLPIDLTKSLAAGDLCGPTICVEIKPKQGFLPSGSRNCCIYGSKQILKLARGKIDKASRYCPIDLFSGCPIRMKSAIQELILNPQNNFRIFRDLLLAYGESNQTRLSTILEDFFELPVQSESRLLDLIIQCLLDRTSDNCCGNSPCYASHVLPETSVLNRVLQAQKLDSIGPKKAQEMLNWLLRCVGAEILEELTKPNMPEGFGSLFRLPQETKRQFHFRKVWEFLVSLTAKDIFIMVTLRRVAATRYRSIVARRPDLVNHMVKDDSGGEYFMFNVGVADLDPKMPYRILNTVVV